MKKSRAYIAYIITLCGSVLVAVMIVLDAVLYPLETDTEPWYYFLLLGCSVFVTVVGLALSFFGRNKYWQDKYFNSKKEIFFSCISISIGFLLLVFSLIDDQKYLIAAAFGFGLLIIGSASVLSSTIGRNVKCVNNSVFSFSVRDVFRAFPAEVHESVEKVLSGIKKHRRSEWSIIGLSSVVYSGFDNVYLPGFFALLPDWDYNTSDINAQIVYYCLQTRSSYGHIREKYVKKILESDRPRWVIPFIIEASSDSVMEVVQAVYDGISEKFKKEISEFYKNNLRKSVHDYSRMVSYWNRYYRVSYPNYRNYVGYKLFTEYYGFEKRYYKAVALEADKKKKLDKLWDLYVAGKLEGIPLLLCDYYSGVMGGGHVVFLINIYNDKGAEGIADYVEKLKDVLDPGLYENLLRAAEAHGTKNELEVCRQSDDYFYNFEYKFWASLEKYADDICFDQTADK